MTATPSPLQPESEQRRRFRDAMLFAGLTPAVFGAALSLSGHWWPFGIADILLGIVVLAVRQWALASHSADRAAIGVNLLAGAGLLAIGWHAVFTGQSESFALWFLTIIPLVSALIGDVRTAVVWTALGAAMATVICLSELWIQVPSQLALNPLMLLLGQLMLMFLAAAYGITARMANDDHVRNLRMANATLRDQAELLAEQSAALQESLRDAQRSRAAADAANRAKSDFLAMMSHEIRTPLNGVIGVHSLLLDMEHLDEDARHYARIGHQSGEALLALVNDFLDFSKIEAGALALEQVPFEPRALVGEVLAMVENSAAAKGLPVRSEVVAPAFVSGDPVRVRQVLLNLVANAVKFTAQGEVSLRCEPLARGDGHTWLRFVVSDTGIGIDPDLQARIFQPFTQADASTTRRFGGTGLGLAICKALTDLMGGTITVSSNAGEGSTFTVELPFAAVRHGAGAAPVRPEAQPRMAGTRARVLVVEDNPVNSYVAAQMLRRLGCEVVLAENGRQAVDACREERFDLVLMDCEMPVMDGFAATRTIRQQERPPRYTPIVAMTAGALAGDRERCLAAGMDDYLAKPARIEDVERALGCWLSR